MGDAEFPTKQAYVLLLDRSVGCLSGLVRLPAFDPMDTNSQMPRGNVRLFRDDFLNNNAILLEYLVQEAQDSPRDEQDCDSMADPDDSRPTMPGFVEKLRAANPTGNEHADDSATQALGSRDCATPLARPSTASALNVQTSNLGIDPSDPNTTIRKLLKHIELLMVSER